MSHRFGSAIYISAALISAVHASTWWPESQQNTWWPNATVTPAATITPPVQQEGGGSGLSMQLGGQTVAAYEPPLLGAATYPDLSQATAVSSVPDNADCSIFAGEVNVYYFPTATPTNTNCFTGVGAGAGAGPPPTAIADPVYPSVYVVVHSLSAGNAHTRIGEIYPSAVFSMMPSDLSTIAGTAGPTQVFNFGDLPCPPPAVASADKYFYDPNTNPTRAYMPRIVPPSQILNLNPGWAKCTFPQNFQFFDPPSAFPSSDGGDGPNDKKRDQVPRAPEAMVTPPPAPLQWHRGHPRQVTP